MGPEDAWPAYEARDDVRKTGVEFRLRNDVRTPDFCF